MSLSPYDFVTFEEKCQIGEVTAALLISIRPPLIPGIHHSGLCSKFSQTKTVMGGSPIVKRFVCLPFNWPQPLHSFIL